MRTKEDFDRIFEEELLPHIDALKTFAFHLALNEADANDLVQETYLKAYRFIDKYEGGTNAKAWLFKILKNAYINEYRKKSKRPTKVDFEEIGAYQEGEISSWRTYTDLREDIFDGMMGDEVTHAINALPLDYKTVILLCDVEDFTYEDEKTYQLADLVIDPNEDQEQYSRRLVRAGITLRNPQIFLSGGY